MNYKEFFETAVEFLCEHPDVDRKLIKMHWTPIMDNPNDMNAIYQRLCDTAQNHHMMANMIGGSIKNGVEGLKIVLGDFDPNIVSKTYKKNEEQLLLDNVIDKVSPTGKVRRTPRSSWPKYCKSVIDGAHFLSRFKNSEDFHNWVDRLYKDPRSKNALPLELSLEIKGISLTLACDFLKEIGYVNYGKPDVHLKLILKAAGYLKLNNIDTLKADYECLNVIDKIANANNKTAYAVDKTIWLIGSGKFHNTDIRIGNQRQKFISRYFHIP